MAKARARGEGTIYKRADGRYEGAVMLPTQGGKTKRVRVYAATRQETHQRLTRLIDDARRGVLPLDRAWTVSEYLDLWLEQEKRRPLTRKRHEVVVRLHIKPRIGRQRLDALTVRSVQNFLDELIADGRSIATAHQVRKVLSAALTHAVRQELLFRNVARLVELPRYKAKEAGHWTPDEIIQFLDAAHDDRFYPIFVLLTLYGLRRSEAVGIRWRDVDFDRDILHIRQQVQRIDGELRQVELKTDSSERDEPLLDQTRDVLLRQQDGQEQLRAAVGDYWQGTGDENELVFTTRTGRPIDSRNLERSFMRICRRHGLRRITIHGLRHSNATTQKSLDVHTRDIQAILGHGDIRTTGIYEHVDLASKRNALQRVEERLFAAADDGVNCRQNCRQTALTSPTGGIDQRARKTSTPVTLAAFLGTPDTVRTCDLRLRRPTGTTLNERLTSIDSLMQTRTRTWKIGCIAVTSAVKSRLPSPRAGVAS